MTQPNPKTKQIRVTVTPGCHNAIKRYAKMRGMTMSQLLYLAFRYNFHREALERPEVREIFVEEGVPFDAKVVDQWRQNIEEQKTLKEIFTPMPPEAFPGDQAHKFSLIKIASRFLLEAPSSAGEAAWRFASATLLGLVLMTGYTVVSHPDIVRSVLGVEDQATSLDHRLIELLQQRT